MAGSSVTVAARLTTTRLAEEPSDPNDDGDAI